MINFFRLCFLRTKTAISKWQIPAVATVSVMVAILSTSASAWAPSLLYAAIILGLWVVIMIGFAWMQSNYKGSAKNSGVVDRRWIALAFWSFDKELTQRMQAENPIVWDAIIQGIKVGIVKDTDYAAMRRYIMRDGTFIRDQALNTLSVCWRLCTHLVVNLPLAMLSVLFWAIVLTPHKHTSELVGIIENMPPEQLASTLQNGFQLVARILILVYAVMLASNPSRFGYGNHFEIKMNELLLHHLRITHKADITLARTVDKDIVC